MYSITTNINSTFRYNKSIFSPSTTRAKKIYTHTHQPIHVVHTHTTIVKSHDRHTYVSLSHHRYNNSPRNNSPRYLLTLPQPSEAALATQTTVNFPVMQQLYDLPPWYYCINSDNINSTSSSSTTTGSSTGGTRSE